MDSTWMGRSSLPPLPLLPGISHPVEIRGVRSPQDTGRPWFSISSTGNGGAGPCKHFTPYPVPTPSPARGGSAQSPSPPLQQFAARPHQPGAYARQLPRQSLCQKQRRGGRGRERAGLSSLGGPGPAETGPDTGGAVAESPIPSQPSSELG